MGSVCHTSDTFPEKRCMKLGGFPVVDFKLLHFGVGLDKLRVSVR